MNLLKNVNNYSFFYLIFMLILFSIFSRLSSPKLFKTQILIDNSNNEINDGQNKLPSDWAWMQRTFPYWQADKTAHLEALRTAQLMRKEVKSSNILLKQSHGINNDVEWEFAGPNNIGGRVVDIEFDPKNPTTVYAAAATGGVFKSIDTGKTWLPIFDEQTVLTIGDIGVDPVNPEIVYVGTGEANGGHNNFPGGGVYKSTDGGQSWQLMGLENTASIGRILVDPLNPQRVFVAAVGSYFQPNPERGIFRSKDGGLSWSNVLFISDSTGAIDIVMNPNEPDTLLAAMWERVRRPNSSHLYGQTSGIYRSFNGGENWELLSNGLPDPTITQVGRIGLALCAGRPNIIYSLYNDGADYTGLYKTIDGGDTWLDVDPDKEISEGTRQFSWYFGQVRVHPTNSNKVFAMDVSLMISENSGENWTIAHSSGLHVDHHALAFHPVDPEFIIEGNDGGINISTNGGGNWTKVSRLPVTQFYEIGLDQSNPQRLYGGTQDNGTMRTLTGSVFDWGKIFGGDGFYVIVDPTDPNIIYAESQFGALAKSTNGGQLFFPARTGINLSEKTNWSTPVVMDPEDSQVLYYGTSRIYRTENGAASWTPISPNLTDGSPGKRLGTVTTIAVAPTNSGVIYAGTDDSHVWVTNDTGQVWTDISAVLPYRWVTRVVVDPKDENIAYVTFSGLKWKDPQSHVFRTENMGLDWQDISGNLPDAPVNALAVDAIDTKVLYLGSDVGAFVSFDSGQSWQPLGTGLPMVSVYDLKIHPTEHFLVAGTHGRSMYKLDLSSLVTTVEAPEPLNVVSGFELMQNYPNPFNPATNIQFTIPASVQNPEQVHLKIFSLTGQLVRTLLSEIKQSGVYTIKWYGTSDSGVSVGSGVYIYQLITESTIQTKKMILLR